MIKILFLIFLVAIVFSIFKLKNNTTSSQKTATESIKESKTMKKTVDLSKKAGSGILKITDAFVDGFIDEYNKPPKTSPNEAIHSD